MIQLGEPLNRKKTIKCPSCGDRILYVLHDRKAGDRLRRQDVRFLQSSKTTVRNPLYCSKCDSPWINKSTGRIIKFNKKIFSVSEIDSEIKDSLYKKDTFKYFKPMIEDCKTIKIKPSELTGCKCRKDEACKAKAEDFFTMIHPVEYISITKLDFENKKIGIKRAGEDEKICDLVVHKKRSGYKADSIIIDECKPLTRRQIKEANDALNKLNAQKPTKKRGA